jgi:chromosome segregation ATPase
MLVQDGAAEWLAIPVRATLSFCALGNVIRKQAMRLPFSGRYAKLETMNRILTDAARKRTERIEELETQLDQLARQVAHLKQELEPARKRARELEVVAAERAGLLNEKDKELADVREALVQRADLLIEKDKELADVREALSQRSLRIQELERTLAQIGRK